ncbi:putative signal transducing protein [Kaarinaea lacus]
MFKIYSAGNIQDAYLLHGLLLDSGIESHILNEYAQGGVGEIPFTHAYPEIWLVYDSDADSARKIVRQFEQRHNTGDDLFCTRCHEKNPGTFETCWHCGKPLTPD